MKTLTKAAVIGSLLLATSVVSTSALATNSTQKPPAQQEKSVVQPSLLDSFLSLFGF